MRVILQAAILFGCVFALAGCTSAEPSANQKAEREAHMPDQKPFSLRLPAKPEIMRVSLDPSLTAEEKNSGAALKCFCDGIIHIRDGKLQFCVEDKWHDVLLQR